MPKWTNEQTQAIKTSNCNLLVSAAAGSGKTAVLTERIITKCSAPLYLDIDRFLIVTFTNAAASEMRQRISTRLSQELEKNPQDNNLIRQLTLINKASITTIHSFCLDLIRNNFHLLDIDPAFRVADQTEAELLKLQAADDIVEKMYENDLDKSFAHLADWLGTDRSDEILTKRIIEIYEFIRSFPYPMQWLDMQIEKYNISDEQSIDTLEWAIEMKKNYIIRLEGLTEASEQLILEAEKEGATYYLTALKSDLVLINGLKSACMGDWSIMWSMAQMLKFPTLGRKPKDADEWLVGMIKEKREKIKKETTRICGDIIYLSPESIIKGLRNAYPLLLTLKNAILKFEQTYNELKKERSILDFGDFEHYALHLLIGEDNSPSALAIELQEKYHEIFVDEYQDCNSVQETIFNLISKKIDGKSVNMFMVGDVKQSIYRFRQADPSIFMQKQNTYGTSGNQCKIMLNKNFRSRNEVLDCVNHIFGRIMSPYVGEMPYGEDEMLYNGADYPNSTLFSPELLIADTNTNEETEDENPDQLETGTEFEARMVANRIKELINSGFEVYDTKKSRYRTAQYSDIVVLMRATASRAEVFEAEFEGQGLPYYTDVGGGFLMSLEVRVMISLLKIIDNPLQDIPLLGVLRSPIFNFESSELLAIRINANAQYFYNCIETISRLDTPLAEKCNAFLCTLKNWRTMAIALPTHLLIQRLLDDTSYYSFAGALPNGEMRQSNLRILYERAKGYEKTNFRGLFNFIDYISKVRKHSDMGGAKVLSENCDVVRIMSIHKSKGLEFPIVFVCGMGSRFNLSSSRGSLLMHRDLGIGADFVDRERHIKYRLLSKLALTERIRIESISEEMRILYVALTRAKEKLIMTGVIKNATEKLSLWQELSKNENKLPLHRTSLANSFCDWVCACMNSKWKFKIHTAQELQQSIIQANNIDEPIDNEIKIDNINISTEIINRLNYIYPYLSSCKLPAKLSVTELKRRFDPSQDENGVKPYLPEMLPRPQFLEERRGLTAAEYGIAMHLVLKHIDLKDQPTYENAEKTIEKLVQGGFMTKPESEAINPQAITNFLISEIGERLRNAKTISRELSFNMKIEASEAYNDENLKGEFILVQGIIDCLFTENDGCVIIDYKAENPRLTENELIERYTTQMRCYAIAAQKILKMPVKAVYLYLLTRKKALKLDL